MTPTARAYTRLHRRADLYAIHRAAVRNGLAALTALAIAAALIFVAGDAVERTAADVVAAEGMGL